MFMRRDPRETGDVELRLDGEPPAKGEPAAEVVDLDASELTEDELEEVELDDVELEDEPEDMDADLESQAADYLADNDVWMYGPNAEAVIEILDRLEDIVPSEARVVAECFAEIPKSDRDHARKAARKFSENDDDLYRYAQLAREAIGTWLAVKSAYPEYVSSEPDWGRLSAQTAEAALDATTAAILEGKLTEAHFEALYEPWSEAIAQLDEAGEAAALDGADLTDAEGPDGEDDEADEADAEKYGPNTNLVTDFMNRLWLITPEQIGRLVSGWQNMSRDDLKIAHDNLKALVDEDPEYRDQVRAAQEKLTDWLNASRFSEQASFLGAGGQGDIRKMAGPALADAVAALVLGDLLEIEDGEVLYGPWFNLIGAPALPEQAPEEETKPAKGKGSKATAAAKPSAKPATKPSAKPATKPAAKGTTPASTPAKSKGTKK